eukprot:EG_transcript_12475
MACFFGTFRSPVWSLLWRQGLRSYATGTQEELFALVSDFVRQQKAMHEELMSRVSILEKTISQQLLPANLGTRPWNCNEAVQTGRTVRTIAGEQMLCLEHLRTAAAPGGPAVLGKEHSLLPHPDAVDVDHYQAPVQDLLQFPGSDAVLQVKLMGPRWHRIKTNAMHCAKAGGLLFDFRLGPTGDADGPDQGSIKITLTPEECAQVLLMDPEVGLCFERDPRTWNPYKPTRGLVTKAMTWSPDRDGRGMCLSAVQSETTISKTETLSVLLQWPQVQLLQLIVERAIPAITGFSWATVSHSPPWKGNYAVFQQKDALRVAFVAPVPRGGRVAEKGAMLWRIASRDEPADAAAPGSFQPKWLPKDWDQAITIVLRDADCARLASLAPARDFSVVHRTPSGGRVQATFKAAEHGGMLVTASGPPGDHQLALTGPELKVIQVVARSLIPAMSGLTQL